MLRRFNELTESAIQSMYAEQLYNSADVAEATVTIEVAAHALPAITSYILAMMSASAISQKKSMGDPLVTPDRLVAEVSERETLVGSAFPVKILAWA